MNSKQAKHLRKLLRDSSKSVADAVYVQSGSHQKMYAGKPYTVTGSIGLDKDCGKGIYRAMKKAMRSNKGA